MIGFLEESEGVRSMSRLAAAWMCALASALVVATCWYVVKGSGKAEVIAALGGMLLTIVAKGAVALVNRNAPDAEK